jgi:hypothetical protein
MKKINMKKITPFLFPLLMVALLIYACDDTITASDLDNVKIPDSNVSYSKYIQPIFNGKCGAVNGCHDTESQKGGVILSSWSTVRNYEIVVPGNIANSKLVWAIEGIGATLMPPQGVVNPLTKNQIAGIKTWIKEGAENN